MGLKPKPEKSALSAQVSTAKWHVTLKLIVLVLAITVWHPPMGAQSHCRARTATLVVQPNSLLNLRH